MISIYFSFPSVDILSLGFVSVVHRLLKFVDVDVCSVLPSFFVMYKSLSFDVLVSNDWFVICSIILIGLV